jgi:hypothetical protein
MEAVLAAEVSMEAVLAEAVFTVGGSVAEHSAVEDLAMDMDAATLATGADLDMDAATMVTAADLDMGSATDTTAGMLAIPSIPTTSVAIIRTGC